MNMNFYYKINQLDGRIENYHLNVDDKRIYDGMLKEIHGQVISVETITQQEFIDGGEPKKVWIHADKNKPGDVKGGRLGYIEHYEIK